MSIKSEAEKEANDAAPISPYLGFALDTSDLSNEVTAIFSVQSEYLYSMTEGLYDEEKYEAFIEKIKTAGLDKYLESVQEQLNAWISE